MFYTKPEIAVLGSADHLIANRIPPKPGITFDAFFHGFPLITPAYDLDE